MLVSTGHGFNGQGNELKDTEVLNFDSKHDEVPTFQNHLKFMKGATGGFVANQFITCGGDVRFEGVIKECYKIGTINLTTLHGSMKEKRVNAASIVLADKLWIFGGKDDVVVANSSEYILIK